MPAGVYRVFRERTLNWNYFTVPELSLNSRSIYTPRGRVVGGSSSINSMVYMRGHRMDYDLWAEDYKLPEWHFRNCLPYFIAGEEYHSESSAWRGTKGRLKVKRSDFPDPLFAAFLEAGRQSNQGYSNDLNGSNPEGLARLDTTISNGRRCSAARAHLKPALHRKNLTLITSAEIQKILLNKKRAMGVEFWQSRAQYIARANAEVIVCAGAINSPALLMKSGIGPSSHLRDCDILPQLHLPGVGQNLQDHAKIRLKFQSKKRLPFHTMDKRLNRFKAGLQWILTRKGIVSSNIWEAGGLIRSHENLSHPNLQYHFGPIGFQIANGNVQIEQAFSLNVDHMRPKSTGYVELDRSNIKKPPKINFKYMSDPHDLIEMLAGVKKARELVSQPAFEEFKGDEIQPGTEFKTNSEIIRMLKERIETAYHPSCTCRMGYDDLAVTDSEFRVHEIDKLRVVDGSAMPRIVSANLNAPIQMMAARAADFILQKQQLPPLDLPYKI